MKFQPGQSGNPNGRPRSDKTKYVGVRRLLEENAASVVSRLIESALEGDIAACKIVIDRVYAPKRSNAISFNLPKISDIQTARDAISSIIEAQTTGVLSTDEADSLVKNIRSFLEVSEIADIEARLKKIEEDRLSLP